MAKAHSTNTRSACQHGPVLVVLALLALGAGCRNAYREGAAVYPPDAGDRLRLRIDQAQAAERRADRAAASLRDQLERDADAPRIASDLDRLEGASLDLRRRVVAARAAADGGLDDESKRELDRLERRAAELLAEVRKNR